MLESLSYEQCAALCEECKTLVGAKFQRALRIGEERFLLYFERHKLILSLKAGRTFFYLSQQRHKGMGAVITHAMEKRFSGAVLKRISLANNDRILELMFDRGYIIAELFSKGANLYVVDQEYKILESLKKQERSHYQYPVNHVCISKAPILSSKQIEEFMASEASEELRIHILRRIHAELKKREKRLIEFEKIIAAGFEREAQELELIQCYFTKLKRGMAIFTIDGHELKLDPGRGPADNLKRFAKRATKARRGVEYANQALAESKASVQEMRKLIEEVESESDLEKYTHWIPEQKRLEKKAKKTHPFREFKTKAGGTIFVGKNAEENDLLTCRFAKGNDVWLHVSGMPGSHVLLRMPQGVEPDRASIEDAAQVALRYSKGRDRGRQEVTVTRAKYVSKRRGSPTGQVMVSKYDRIDMAYDKKHFEALSRQE